VVVRRTIGVIAAALVLAHPVAAHSGPWCWTLGKTMRRIDGTRVHAGSRTVRVHSDTTLCSGDGWTIRRAGKRYWKHFLCTYTTNGGLGRDIGFRVHVRGKLRFLITDAHWIG
jgi:hypothetical protein